MSESKPFAICSNRAVLPDATRPAAILIEGEKITGIVAKGEVPADFNRHDYGDAVVMPGLVDTHVHINEPGRTEWEGFETATKAAAAGGVTTLVDMPLNSSPVTTSVAALGEKLTAARGKLYVDCGFHAGLIPGNEANIEALIDTGVLGVKVFLSHSGIDDFPNATEVELRRVMPLLASQNIPLLVHAELEDETISPPQSSSGYQDWLAARPRRWEQRAIELMIQLCAEYRCRTHIVHLSSADALPALARGKSSGLPLSTETCPHYLFFCAEQIADSATFFKCAPPIREKENRERLWQGLIAGTIDLIVSDHSPCPPPLKLSGQGDFIKAWGGIASLQFGLPIVWTAAKQRGHSLLHIAQWMSAGPAELAGLQEEKGKIAAGFDADLLVFHPEKSFIITEGIVQHRHKSTPYLGERLHGVVEMTYLRGRPIYKQGRHLDGPSGTVLLNARSNDIN